MKEIRIPKQIATLPNIGSPWQPIATAPRDDTPIDLWAGSRIPDCKWEVTGNIRPPGYEGTEGWRALSRDYETRQPPTFWMPVPRPPR